MRSINPPVHLQNNVSKILEAAASLGATTHSAGNCRVSIFITGLWKNIICTCETTAQSDITTDTPRRILTPSRTRRNATSMPVRLMERIRAQHSPAVSVSILINHPGHI